MKYRREHVQIYQCVGNRYSQMDLDQVDQKKSFGKEIWTHKK